MCDGLVAGGAATEAVVAVGAWAVAVVESDAERAVAGASVCMAVAAKGKSVVAVGGAGTDARARSSL